MVPAAAFALLFQAAVPAAASPSKEPVATLATAPFVTLDRIAAIVGDEILLESELDRLVEVGVEPRRPGERDAPYRDRVLDQRVVDLLRERQLRRTGGLEPGAREVEARLQALVARVEKERGEPFERVLDRARVTREEVRAWIRRGLALETYVRERIAPTVKLTEAELKAYYDGPFREEAGAKGLAALPPLQEVQDQLRDLVRERKLNAEIERWTEGLRAETRILIYRRGPSAAAGAAGTASESR